MCARFHDDDVRSAGWLRCRFGETKFVPIFRKLELTSYAMNATSALQAALAASARELDADCVEYLSEILSNAVRFVEWIQSGMN